MKDFFKELWVKYRALENKYQIIIAVVITLVVIGAFSGDSKANIDPQPEQSELEYLLQDGFAIDTFTPDGREFTVNCQPFKGSPGYYVCKLYPKQ